MTRVEIHVAMVEHAAAPKDSCNGTEHLRREQIQPIEKNDRTLVYGAEDDTLLESVNGSPI
jgi:hypothetical protein